MKRFLIIALLVLSLTSCTNTPTKVENPKEVTTVELQQLASIDSTTYKVVEKGGKLYVLSTKDNMVVKKVNNDSGLVSGLFNFIFILLVIISVCSLLYNSY